MSSINVQGPEGDPDIHLNAQPTRIAAGGIVLLTAETQLDGHVHGRMDGAGTRAAVGPGHPHRAAGRHHRHRGSADPPRW